jgi:hypothetical protein
VLTTFVTTFSEGQKMGRLWIVEFSQQARDIGLHPWRIDWIELVGWPETDFRIKALMKIIKRRSHATREK